MKKSSLVIAIIMAPLFMLGNHNCAFAAQNGTGAVVDSSSKEIDEIIARSVTTIKLSGQKLQNVDGDLRKLCPLVMNSKNVEKFTTLVTNNNLLYPYILDKDARRIKKIFNKSICKESDTKVLIATMHLALTEYDKLMLELKNKCEEKFEYAECPGNQQSYVDMEDKKVWVSSDCMRSKEYRTMFRYYHNKIVTIDNARNPYTFGSDLYGDDELEQCFNVIAVPENSKKVNQEKKEQPCYPKEVFDQCNVYQTCNMVRIGYDVNSQIEFAKKMNKDYQDLVDICKDASKLCYDIANKIESQGIHKKRCEEIDNRLSNHKFYDYK